VLINKEKLKMASKLLNNYQLAAYLCAGAYLDKLSNSIHNILKEEINDELEKYT